MNYVIKSFRAKTKEYLQALDLRRDVLRKPLGLEFTEEELKKDETDIHFGLFVENQIRACLTLTFIDSKNVKVRQVAVDKGYQKNGFGKLLSNAAESYAISNGFEVIFCHARKSAAGFYSSLGYTIEGKEFLEVGIPHFVMKKALK